jgi:hypothetical protein
MSMRVRVLSGLAVGVGLLGLSLLALLAHAVAADGPSSAPASTCPSFSSSNFHRSTKIGEPYFPTPGHPYTYGGNQKNQSAVMGTVDVTGNTPTVAGVRTVELRDRLYVYGALRDDTLDWYAQDDQGNFWLLGEFTTEFTTDSPSGSHEGSWTAGVDGASGYIVASPHWDASCPVYVLRA